MKCPAQGHDQASATVSSLCCEADSATRPRPMEGHMSVLDACHRFGLVVETLQRDRRPTAVLGRRRCSRLD